MSEATIPSATLTDLIELFKAREAAGLVKYGTTVDRDDLSLADWLQHALEESMDKPIYLMRALKKLRASQPAEQPRGEPLPDPKLLDFYCVTSWRDLVAAQEEHVLKLQDAARRNVKPGDDTFPPTLLPKYLRDTGLIDADKVSAYEVAAPSIGYWTAVKKCVAAESIVEDHRAAGVTDTTVTRLYAAQPKPEQAVGDGVVAAHRFVRIDDGEPGPWNNGDTTVPDLDYPARGFRLERAYKPRPAVATPAEVMDEVAETFQKAWDAEYVRCVYGKKDPKQARLSAFKYALSSIPAALAAQSQARKDGQGVDDYEIKGFGEWLHTAYSFEGNGHFTRFNMEVAYAAGMERAALASPSAGAVVPEEWLLEKVGGEFDDMTAGQGYRRGWNECRAAMLAAAPEVPGHG